MEQLTPFKEGQIIQFTIKNIIEFPENDSFFVLEDSFGRKQLLTTKYYKNYQFKIGQTITCKVDHINCSGKIFLEPEHPFYKENEVYDFIIDNIKKTENRLKETVFHIDSIDKTGNTATYITENISDSNYKSGQKVQYKIERIKKGKLYLSIVNQISSEDLKQGVYYKFKIEDIKILKDKFKYYILSDKKNRKHLLRYEYYTHHNLQIGQIIKCTVIKYSSKGYHILEPKHPFYKKGRKYKFEFIKQEKDFKGEITGNYDITVKDIYGEEVKFVSEKQINFTEKNSDKILCIVNDIKKGTPILSLV